MPKIRGFLSAISKHYPYILLAIFLFIGAYLRLHNLTHYHTFWADDGGGHAQYMDIIYYQHRLPILADTYLAWHEPLYYILLFPWQKIGLLFGVLSITWAASMNIFIYVLFLLLVWKLSGLISKNTITRAVNVSLFSVLFIGVKLSAYINNELLAQTYILFLIYFFIKLDLLAEHKLKKVFFWSILLAIGLWIKLTIYIVLVSVLLFYIINIWQRKYLWRYILLIVIIPVALNIPWLLYKKNNFNAYFTINIYDAKPRQNILTSDAWKYILTINTNIFTDYPYWYKLPHSYFSILLSDSFGDYYNLFNNNIKIGALAEEDRILVGNGRYTTPAHWRSLLNTNRLGLGFFIIWCIGFIAFVFSVLKKKIPFNNYFILWLIVLSAGWGALFFNNLRLPYLEAGVLKGHFIYYTYPLFTILAYFGLEKIIKNKIILSLIFFLPLIIYVILGWRLLKVW